MDNRLGTFSTGDRHVKFTDSCRLDTHTCFEVMMWDQSSTELPIHVLDIDDNHKILVFRNGIYIDCYIHDPHIDLKVNGKFVRFGPSPSGVEIIQIEP